MISYIRGRLVYKADDFVIVDKDGIGFNVQVSAGMLQRLPAEGSDIMLYTFMNVKEAEISLFGFASMDELKLFNRLITVSGVGPKSAAALLGVFTPNQLCIAIAAEDSKLISKGPGIGKKTAQKIILELKDRVGTTDMFGSGTAAVTADSNNENVGEAIQALESLGFTRAEAFGAINGKYVENMSSSEIVRLALKSLNRI